MAGSVHRFAHGADVGGDTGGRFVVHHQDRRVGVVPVGAQPLMHQLRRHACPPRQVDLIHDHVQTLCALCKLVAELPDVEGEHAVVGIQGVDNGGLPSAGAGAGKQHDLTGRSLEDLGEAGGDFRDQSRKLRPTMVGDRPIHRA